MHVALWAGGELTAAAVALPGLDEMLLTDPAPALPPRPDGAVRIAVSRTRPAGRGRRPSPPRSTRELVPLGSAGYKTVAVARGEVDAYVHAGGQYQWDSAAPVAVARAAGLTTCRLDGSPLVYNAPDPWLPDLVVCRPELADRSSRDGRCRMRPFVLYTWRSAPRLRRPCRPCPRPRGATRVTTPDYRLSQLETLEAESIHVFREVAAELERPVLLFSGGKDSIVMLELARKAFAPARIPFPVMHVDTGLNFPEVLEFRDRRVAELGVHLIVASVPEAIADGLVREEPNGSRNRIQTPVLLDAVEKHGFTALFGGARRDEDKARAKERMFSFRDEFGQWDPKNQRPELWDLYNGRIHLGESIRVFPLSNWTELDIWQYIAREEIAIPDALPGAGARGRRAAGDALRGQRVRPAPRGRAGAPGDGALPHRGRRQPDRGRAVERRPPSRRSSPRSR